MAKKITTIGGQALMEGIMMVGPTRTTAAFCSESGVISTEDLSVSRITKKYPILGKPFIRGIFSMIDTFRLGYKALSLSADKVTEDLGEEELTGLDKWLDEHLGDKLTGVIMTIGTVLGLLAGYYGGWIEMLVMRGADVLFSFPDILLAIAIVALLGPGIINVFIAVAVFTVPSFARMMRSATLAVKSCLYVEVARSLGCKDGRILFIHIFPGTIQTLIVNFTMRIGSAIMAASSLSFLGFGADVTSPEWGAMLSQSRSYLNTAPHMVYFPALVIFITVLAFNLFGDGLRDTLDPKIK